MYISSTDVQKLETRPLYPFLQLARARRQSIRNHPLQNIPMQGCSILRGQRLSAEVGSVEQVRRADSEPALREEDTALPEDGPDEVVSVGLRRV